MATHHHHAAQVDELFARGTRRSTRIGIEHELVAVATDGGVVPLEQSRRALARRPSIGFEPGGQVELSLPCVPRDRLEGQFRRAVGAVRAACAEHGIELRAVPTDPRADVPLQLLSPRYVAMQRHFDSIGPAGRRMMRRTASTQVCLDWWPGAAGAEQWRLLNLAGPFLAAAFARETGPGSRLATWLEVDPARTAFDGRLVADDDPRAAYLDLARRATAFAEPHLTTLFPPVRPRGRYLEVRFADVQDDDGVAPYALALGRLLYDDEARRAALHELRAEGPRLEQHWHDAAYGADDVRERGTRILERSAGLVGAA